MTKTKGTKRGGGLDLADLEKYWNQVPYTKKHWKDEQPTHRFKNMGLQQGAAGKIIGLTFDKAVHILNGDKHLKFFASG